jgi:cytochrome oxidase assembly protein ShyY1
MSRFLLAPKWLAFHLICLLLMAGMVWAGFWQLSRYHHRQDFKAQVLARINGDVQPFATAITSGPPGQLEWQRVQVSGTYVTGKAFEVVNLSQGGQSGHDAVSGLLLADGTVLVVNRGFAPGATALPPAPTGQVTLIGWLRVSQKAGTAEPADDGTKTLTQIRRVDLGALRQQFTQTVQPMFIDALQSTPKETTLQTIAFPDLDGGPPHLSYTIQWFIFTVCVAIGWGLVVKNAVDERSGKPKKRKKVLIPEQYASGG